MSAENASPLRNGNPQYDLRHLPCCGARTRQGVPCRQPRMANGKCRFHGGQSTGPRTAQGKERQREAVTRHGLCTPQGRGLFRLARVLRAATRRMKQGDRPKPEHGTYGAWLAAPSDAALAALTAQAQAAANPPWASRQTSTEAQAANPTHDPAQPPTKAQIDSKSHGPDGPTSPAQAASQPGDPDRPPAHAPPTASSNPIGIAVRLGLPRRRKPSPRRRRRGSLSPRGSPRGSHPDRQNE